MAEAAEACGERRAALAQRAALLAAIWADASRPQSVLAGLLRPFPMPALPPCDEPVRDYAVDMACAPDGEWRVVRDRVTTAAAALLEAPVLAAFLPELCRRLLGQSLRLPSMPAWWLGDGATLARLAACPSRYCVRPGFAPDAEGMPLGDLSPAERDRLQRSVMDSPRDLVANFNLRLSVRRFALEGGHDC